MTCIHIYRKIFGFKINPQNTVTLSILRCNDFQPLMRYFCQMKLMMPASKQTPRLAHLKHSVPHVGSISNNAKWQPYREDFCFARRAPSRCAGKPTQALCLNAPKPSQHLTPTNVPYQILFCRHIQISSVQEMTQWGRWGTKGSACYQRC